IADQSQVANRKLSIQLGERVTVSTLNADGVVTALGESDAEVQIGSLRVRARLVDLVRKGQEAESPEEQNETRHLHRTQVQVKQGGVGEHVVTSTKSPG